MYHSSQPSALRGSADGWCLLAFVVLVAWLGKD